MNEEPKKPKAGFVLPPPPVKEISWTAFEELCGLQCTQEEIAAVLEISVDALYYKVRENYEMSYSDVYKKYAAQGRPSLRRSQRILADKNPAMAIWLGKNWLGQRDNLDMAVSGGLNVQVVQYGEEGTWKEEQTGLLGSGITSDDTLNE